MIRQPGAQRQSLRADHHALRPFGEKAHRHRARRRRHRIPRQAYFRQGALRAHSQRGCQPASLSSGPGAISRPTPAERTRPERSTRRQPLLKRRDLRLTAGDRHMAQRKNSNPSVGNDADHEMITPLHGCAAAAAAVAATIRWHTPRRRWHSSRASSAPGCTPNASASKRRGRTLSARDSPRRRTTSCFAPPTTSRAKPPPSAIQLWPAPRTACAGCSSTPRIGPHPDGARRPARFDAVRAIVREYSRPDLAEMAGALTARLRDVTDEFLEHENSFRPDYLESIFAPPLVPGAPRR